MHDGCGAQPLRSPVSPTGALRAHDAAHTGSGRPVPQTTLTCASFDDSSKWAQHLLGTIGRHFDMDNQRAIDMTASCISGLTMSTSFSGIAAPEVAMNSVFLTVRHFAKSYMPNDQHPRTLWCCDCDAKCRAELGVLIDNSIQLQCGTDTCVFGDITDFIRPNVKDVLISQSHRMTPEDFTKVCKQSFVCQRAYCHRHQCDCDAQTAFMHVAETPCPDWSRYQHERKGQRGSSSLCFFTWVSQRRLLQESCILHENVVDFPVAMLEASLGGSPLSSCMLPTSV